MTNEQIAAEYAKRLAEEVERAAGKGIGAAGIFLAARVKEEVSVPAPRRKYTPPGGGVHWVATTPATAGAAPRKLSGRLRGSVHSQQVSRTEAVVSVDAKSDQGFGYPGHLEEHGHPFLAPTAEKHKDDLAKIVGSAIVSEVGG